MNYWLVKTEPSEWSWEDQVKLGARGGAWTGVRNPAAQKNLRAMKKGDRVFFYHTGDEKRIVGVAEVVKEAHPDPTEKSGRMMAVGLRALKALDRAVTLAEVKAEPRLKELALVRQGRLSVMEIDEASWKLICKMGGC